uniref:Zinc finger protein 26 n=1 Tax=Zeugodacus cucurbitae TaxID=28588 RepID=A0A0A1XKP2_ZEUCU
MAVSIQKCGEITTSLTRRKREYFLKCMFCDKQFLTLDKFCKHVEFVHLHLSDGYEQEIEEYKMPEDTIIAMDSGQEEKNVFIDIEVLDNSREEPQEIEGIIEVTDNEEAGDYFEVIEYQEDGKFDGNYNDTLVSTTYDYEETDEELSDTEKDSRNDPLKMFDKETMNTIFSSFENYSILWDRADPTSKNHHLRSIAYKSLASDVGKLNQWKKVRDLVRKLNHRLRQELERKRHCMSMDEDYIPWWLKDMDSFVRIRKLENKKFVVPPSILTEPQRKIFIKCYKGFTCLWNEIDNDYRLPNKREEAMIEMGKILLKHEIALTQSEIAQEIAGIRKICCQEKKIKLRCEELNIAYIPHCASYEQIRFLEVDVGPFKCDICSEILPGLNNFKMHKSKHDGIKPFTCPLCGNSFTTVHSLNIHINRHSGDYKYICKYCERSFPALSELNVHERSHTGERPYFCDQCGKTFRVWVYYDSHIRRHQNRPGYKCSICSKNFFGAQHLNEHMSIHRKERDQVCNVCGKAFKMAKYLRQHKQIHSTNKKYICKICDKAFAQYAGLSGHMKTHGTTLVGNNIRINTVEDDSNEML